MSRAVKAPSLGGGRWRGRGQLPRAVGVAGGVVQVLHGGVDAKGGEARSSAHGSACEVGRAGADTVGRGRVRGRAVAEALWQMQGVVCPCATLSHPA